MFAPKVAEAQSKGGSSSAGKFAQRTRHPARNERNGNHEREIVRENLTDLAAPLGIAWDFGKILFPPDPTSRPQASSQLPGIIQPKLVVGAVNDPLEHEADRVADQVMQMPDPDVSTAAAPPQVSRKCAPCEEEEKLRRKPSGGIPAEGPGIVREALASGGQALDVTSRAFFEPRFGHDFSRVRIYTDERAGDSARALGALAYTVGQAIVFGRGAFSASSQAGQRLLAHELTHVVQQSAGSSAVGPVAYQRESDPPAVPGMVQRQPNMPSPAPTLGGLNISYNTATGALSVTAAGPQSTPIVSSPQLGVRHDPNGSWHILVGGKDKVVATDEIPKLLRDATGQAGQGARPAAQTFRVPTCNELRLWSSKEKAPSFLSFVQFQNSRKLWHSGLPGGGALWLDLTKALYDALIEICIQESLPLPKPPQESEPMQDLPGWNLPSGQAVA
jgi:anti-sigma factor RsiW